MIKKIILSIFPKTYWLLLILGIILYQTNQYYILGSILVNLAATLFFIRVAIVIHEVGHLCFAKLAGGNPRRIILGNGHEIVRMEVYNIKVVINSSIKSGFAISNFDDKRNIKWKQFLNILGGPLSNITIALLFYVAFGFNKFLFTGETGIDLNSSFIIANAMLGVFSLLPYKVNYYGIKVPTDGLSLIKLPFEKRKSLDKFLNEDDFFEGLEYYENKEYDKAINVFNKYLKFDDTKLASLLNLSVMYLKKGDFNKSFDLLQDSLELVNKDDKSNYKAFVNNNIAWLYLIREEYENAAKHSKIANDINNKEPNFIGTRGSALIETGEVNLGIDLLKPLVDMVYINTQTLCASMYLAYGYYQKSDIKKQKKYLNFVLKNKEILGVDELKILDNITSRIESTNIT